MHAYYKNYENVALQKFGAMRLLQINAPCAITFTLQNGLQPIHHAAQEGHEDIVMILVDDFNVKPDAVSLVCLCIVNSVVMLCTIM